MSNSISGGCGNETGKCDEAMYSSYFTRLFMLPVLYKVDGLKNERRLIKG